MNVSAVTRLIAIKQADTTTAAIESPFALFSLLHRSIIPIISPARGNKNAHTKAITDSAEIFPSFVLTGAAYAA